MTKAITTESKAVANGQACQAYLPLKAFFEKMHGTKEANPYKSTFSFQPFLDKMRDRKKGIQNAVGDIDSKFMTRAIDNLSAYLDPTHLDTPQKRADVMALLFPALFFEGQIGFVAKPFTKEFFFMTPAMEEVFTSDNWEIKVHGMLEKGKMNNPAIEAGKLILNTFHGQNFGANSYQTMTFRNRETQLEQHFKVNVVLEFIKTTPLKPFRELTGCELHALYNEWDNEEHWLKLFPPEDYTFEGLVVGYIQDVTETEVLSEMKEMLITDVDAEDEDPAEVRENLNRQISTYLRMPDVIFGNLMNRDFKYAHLSSWSLMGGIEEIADFSKEDFMESVTYGKALKSWKPVIIGDLQRTTGTTRVELQLIEKGYRSLLLVPLKDQDGQLLGVMEFGSKEAYRFNRQVLDKLGEIISLFTIGTHRWIQAVDNRINFFIQKQFTYIHPSVEWKFQEVSQKFLLTPPDQEQPTSLEQIGFKNVYPLYGQADIVGSSKIRNDSIQADMLDNLQRVQKVIKAFRKRLQFQLLDIYLAQTEAFVQRLENGGYVSSDESQIVELLVGDIHPLLRELSDKYEQLPKGVLKKYFDYLDPKLDIVYRERKKYEDSVHDLNNLISHYIDQEVAKKQEVLPHFFEKYTTDGVEYNIYLGQSLLPEGKFSYYFLKDFRLWQLILMCEVTRLVEKNKTKFQVPLTTAQLVFVYNNDLSIRFNMDEKQFDVDGAYNVRYEILKKRIDKAVIKGTKERLTQKGKVAIVWLQEKDRVEYLEYLHHLRDQGFITDNIEELELERLQGADGLKALRVTVAV